MGETSCLLLFVSLDLLHNKNPKNTLIYKLTSVYQKMLSPLLAPELSKFVDPKVAGYHDGWPDDGVGGRKLLRLGLAANDAGKI